MSGLYLPHAATARGVAPCTHRDHILQGGLIISDLTVQHTRHHDVALQSQSTVWYSRQVRHNTYPDLILYYCNDDPTIVLLKWTWHGGRQPNHIVPQDSSCMQLCHYTLCMVHLQRCHHTQLYVRVNVHTPAPAMNPSQKIQCCHMCNIKIASRVSIQEQSPSLHPYPLPHQVIASNFPSESQHSTMVDQVGSCHMCDMTATAMQDLPCS